jgi:hypothetical protein
VRSRCWNFEACASRDSDLGFRRLRCDNNDDYEAGSLCSSGGEGVCGSMELEER